MGKPTGFKEYDRELPRRRPVQERVGDFKEVYEHFPEEKVKTQAARCMDCGVPTCISGCPLGNLIPEWNDAVYPGRWREAVARLHATNNFPEFTGRLCPAPCEEACVLSINEPPVTIEQIEKEIIEHAFAQGWIRPEPPKQRTGKTVAVIGSGPAGLACAQQLNRAGHQVTVFERADRIGGLLRYGIPDFKMEKWVIDRRLKLMAAEGIRFRTHAHLGVNLDKTALAPFDAVMLCLGATIPRDLPLPGRDLQGIHFAMPFLTQQNRIHAGDAIERLGSGRINAHGKHAVVIGGGDTGSDCIGTCLRLGAASVVNFEAAAMPPAGRPERQPWPYYPMRLRTSSSHEEGGERHWSILTKEFAGADGHVTALVTVDIRMTPQPGGPPKIEEIPNTEKRWPADLVLIAIGYTGPETGTIAKALDLAVDPQGTFTTNGRYMTRKKGVFAAGDANRGQSLIVWAISEGREAAREADLFLMGESRLPAKGCCDLPLIR
ncbi:MAG: glutamate synthase subunit beta [Desulfatitalea sp.]|nr:glutamate synthase subunit beta [Desulfatitalea sp.]